MARAGMTRWRSRNCSVSDGCDEVQKSLDLLDKVLSEFDDCDANGVGNQETTSEKSPSYVLQSQQQLASAAGADKTDAAVVVVAATELTATKTTSASLKRCGSTPEDESSSGLGGHQSEDDGYMSMNGRKAKLLMIGSGSSTDFTNGDESNGVTTPETPELPKATAAAAVGRASAAKTRLNGDFPPPPEEAERIISTLLPRVSPCSSSQRNRKNGRDFLNNVVRSFDENTKLDKYGRSVTTATQTTLPKTKHQRPFGWQKEIRQFRQQPPYHHIQQQQQSSSPSVARNGAAAKTYSKYGSLPYDGVTYYDNGGNYQTSSWLLRAGGGSVSPRTASALDRHRETAIRRCGDSEESLLNTVQESVDEDPANFSDDSLEDVPPPPPPAAGVASTSTPQQPTTNKRSSIAWEVSLESNTESLLVPGSTKVVGRRRRKSTDHSSTGSLTTLNVYDDWPEPPNGTDDHHSSCLTSDTEAESASQDGRHTPFELAKKSNAQCGTYVIRRGAASKRDRIHLLDAKQSCQKNAPHCNGETDLKRCSSTFDNIKSLLKEGLVEGLDDSPPDFQPPKPPALTRGVSLPNILNDSTIYENESKTSFITETTANESISSLEQILEGGTTTTTTSSFARKLVDDEPLTCAHYVSKGIWTESDRVDLVEKQSVAVQVSADFSLLNKEIAEQSTSCQTDNEELDYCVNKAANTAENITSTSTFKRDAKEKRKRPEESGDEVDGAVVVEKAKPSKTVSLEQLFDKDEVKTKKNLNLDIASAESRRELSLNSTSSSDRKTMAAAANDANRVWMCNGSLKSKAARGGDFRVNVEVMQHEFGPLPPSPVEEVEDEYSDVLQCVPTTNRKTNSLSNDCSAYRRNSRASVSGSIRSSRGAIPEVPPHHRDHNSSLKTRSVDAGFTRNHRTQFINSRKEVPVERRTLPTDLPGTHRRPYQKRGSQSPKDENAQVSCSLPETPIFARGCDIPRTPLRGGTAEKSNSSRTTPRLNGIQTSGYMRTAGSGHGTCLGEAMAGAELLRLTGPGRGWYPRHRQPRPASVEHLDRLTPQGLSPSAPSASIWDARESRKPLTLPPNLSPKFFQRSPREALRRVTSLLIRKGGSTKDTKSKDVFASSVIGPHGDFGESSRQQKRGFFRSFWKRSRHYSLDQQ